MVETLERARVGETLQGVGGKQRAGANWCPVALKFFLIPFLMQARAAGRDGGAAEGKRGTPGEATCLVPGHSR
jgi:hypothetical protein